MDKVKIVSFDIENVKRVQAVKVTPAETGLTTLGGDNYQGKSSCLDAIMNALGGEKFTPSDPVHDGAKKGQTVVELSNDITVTRSFTDKGTYLKIDAPHSSKSGQGLLNEFINSFALNLSSFLTITDKARASILLEIIGVDLTPFDEKSAKLEADRLAVGRLEVKAKGHAESMPYDEAAGSALMTPTDIIAELEQKVAKNAANTNLRMNVSKVQDELDGGKAALELRYKRINELESALDDARKDGQVAFERMEKSRANLATAKSKTVALQDEDTTSIKTKLTEIDAVNARIRQNLERDKAFEDVATHHEEYTSLQHQIEDIRDEKQALLNGAHMPLEELSVENSILTYKGHAWDCMSHAEQLVAATAICQAINPNMGFVLIDKLESMDVKTLREFGAWLEKEGLQAITTRVSKGSECSVIIEDGLVVGRVPEIEAETVKFD